MEPSRNQIGRLGETAVALELMKRGYDVINPNDSIQNFAHADLLCTSPISGKATLIQVKTGTTKNIQCGLISTHDGIIAGLEESVVCPWIFVHVTQNDDGFAFEFYVLSRDETINLIKSSNDWYTRQWKSKLSNNVHIGVEIAWVQAGKSEKTRLHPEYNSSLKKTAQNRWDKISI